MFSISEPSFRKLSALAEVIVVAEVFEKQEPQYLIINAR